MIELQNIDTNCNNCVHMVRDSETYTKWMRWHRILKYLDFRRERTKAFEDAKNEPTEAAQKAMLYYAKKMKFFFEKKYLLQYGKCIKFNKNVCFIPDTTDINNTNCFQNRRTTN